MRDDVARLAWRAPAAVLCATGAFGALAVASTSVPWLLVAPLVGLVASSLTARFPRMSAGVQLLALGAVAALAPLALFGFVVLALVLLAIRWAVMRSGG